MNPPLPTPSPDDDLRELHEEYVDAVNSAVAEDRDDLVVDLVARYPDAALALLSRAA